MNERQPQAKKPAVIASRKSCDTTGTGLSHYILVDKKGGK